jgi:hypothetical protein
VTEYLYVPFPKANMGTDAGIGSSIAGKKNVIYSNLSVFDGDTYKGGVGSFVATSMLRGIRVLSPVGAEDTLTILGHGVGGEGDPVSPNLMGSSAVKGPTGGSRARALTAPVLAGRLAKEGLTKDIITINLTICYGALGGGFIHGHSMLKPDVAAQNLAVARDCFGQILAKSLGALGYAKIRLYAYTGEVVASGAAPGGTLIITGFKPNPDRWARDFVNIRQTMGESVRIFDHQGREIVETRSRSNAVG